MAPLFSKIALGCTLVTLVGGETTFAINLAQDHALSPLLGGAYVGGQFIRFAFDFDNTATWIMGELCMTKKCFDGSFYKYDRLKSGTAREEVGEPRSIADSLRSGAVQGKELQDDLLFQRPKGIDESIPDLEVSQHSFIVASRVGNTIPEGVSGAIGLGRDDASPMAFINRLRRAKLDFMALNLGGGDSSSSKRNIVFTSDDQIMGECLGDGSNGLLSTQTGQSNWQFAFDLVQFGADEPATIQQVPSHKHNKRAIHKAPSATTLNVKAKAVVDPQVPFIVAPEKEATKMAAHFAKVLGLSADALSPVTIGNSYHGFSFDCDAISSKTRKKLRDRSDKTSIYISGEMVKRPFMLASADHIIRVDDECYTPYAFIKGSPSWIIGRPAFQGQVIFDLDSGDLCQQNA